MIAITEITISRNLKLQNVPQMLSCMLFKEIHTFVLCILMIKQKDENQKMGDTLLDDNEAM